MGNFTVPLWEAIELTGGYIEREHGMMIPRDTRIGIEHYPIFDERHRDTLNSHIVSMYYNREIGHSTISEFRMRLQATLAMQMPTFNEMYKANLIEFDPLTTMRIENEREDDSSQDATSTNQSKTQSDGKTGNRTVFSDTPGVRLKGDGDYATNANDAHTWSEASAGSDDKGITSATASQKGKSLTTGYSSSPAALVRQRQELLLNVDALVVSSLEGLFFGLWNNYDSTTEGSNYGT